MNPQAKLVITVASALSVAGCTPPPPPAAPPKVVRTLIVGASESTNRDVYSGDVRARYETALGFRVPGKLQARLVDVGAVVRAGQVLARLDPVDAGLQVVQVEAQRSLAEADVKRYRELRAKGFVSQAVLDGREVSYQAADAQARLAKNQAAYTTLVANRAGVIAGISAEPGQVLAAGQAVLRLAPDGEREVAISVTEDALMSLKPGMVAEVRLWAGNADPGASGKALPGKIREISPAADQVTRTYSVRVSLPAAQARLPLGLTASVRFPSTGKTSALRIPLAAIYQKGTDAAVWLVADTNTLTLKPVTVSAYVDNTAMVSAGLNGGERIVAAGAHMLTEGQTVRLGETVK